MYKGKLLTGAVLSVFMAGAYGNASAADGTSDAVYSLNPVVVTATRYEKSDAEIPAATQTFTEEQIEQTGADNLQVALQYLDGVIDAGMGPNGTSVSSMTTKNVIRGVSNGTVVMINGTPINWRTNYNLENIPTSAVERVEVVRGGGAVLYGSQATGRRHQYYHQEDTAERSESRPRQQRPPGIRRHSECRRPLHRIHVQ